MNKWFCIVALVFLSSGVNASVSGGGIWTKVKDSLYQSHEGSRAFKGRSGTIYQAGGARIRMRQSTPANIVDFTPPSFNVGCNGIDMTLGALGFANLPQIETLLANLGQGALMAVAMLTMKASCPQCQAVIESVQAAIQAANALNKGACEWAGMMSQHMDNRIANAEDRLNEGAAEGDTKKELGFMKSLGAVIGGNEGDGPAGKTTDPEDKAENQSKVCQDYDKAKEGNSIFDSVSAGGACGLTSAAASLEGFFDVVSPASWMTDRIRAKESDTQGNNAFWIWKSSGLNEAFATIAEKQAWASLFMSMFEVADNKGETTNTKTKAIAAGVPITMLMCGKLIIGTEISAAQKAELDTELGPNSLTFNFCNSLQPRLRQVLTCDLNAQCESSTYNTVNAQSDLEDIVEDALLGVYDSAAASPKYFGLFYEIDKIIKTASNAVEAGTFDETNADHKHVIELFERSRYPIDRLINLNIAFPELASQILGQYINLMSIDLAGGWWSGIIEASMATNALSTFPIPPSSRVSLTQVLTKSVDYIGSMESSIKSRMELEQILLTQIKQLDTYVQRQAYSNGIYNHMMRSSKGQ